MVSEKECQLPMEEEFWLPAEQKEEKNLLLPLSLNLKGNINNIQYLIKVPLNRAPFFVYCCQKLNSFINILNFTGYI